MSTPQPVVAIVDGSSYMDRIAGILIRNGFGITTYESIAGGLSRDLESAAPFAIVYCVRDEHPSAERVRRTRERFVRLQPAARVIVCSGDFQFVQSLRSAGQDDGVVVLYEPFVVEMLLEAIGTPGRPDAHASQGCV